MKTVFAVLRSRGASLKAIVATCAVAGVSSAQAALPTWATTAGADLGGSVGDFEGMVGPIILAVSVAMVGIRLFKRFTAKI